MEQMHLSTVKLWMNSILDPKGLILKPGCWMFWGFGFWKGYDIYGEVYDGIPMEQMHFSTVKMWPNSILDPKF